MNTLSLFDGMSCGQQALERTGIPVENYFASEVDKSAIKITMANYPNTKQLGDVRSIVVTDLPTIHLLIGGSPCTSFSFAGSRKGMITKDNIEILTLEHYLQLKSEDYEFEGQSYLFWEYIRVLTDIRKTNPNVLFLLENVMMGVKWQRVITQAIGINPININSALVSAQNRERLYWTNIYSEPDGFFADLKCMIPQPKDKGILLKDILEDEVDKKYYLSDKMIEYVSKSGTKGFYYKPEFCTLEGKARPITTVHDKRAGTTNYIKSPMTENQQKKLNELTVNTNKSGCLTEAIGRGGSSDEYISMVKKNAILTGKIRRLTPVECERLQTVKDGYTSMVSDTGRYKTLGNGWTVDVIAYILSYINK